MSLSFDLAAVELGIQDTQFAGLVRHVTSAGSTNQLAVEAAASGQRVGVWIADEQTAGRGRGGHGWVSTAGDGLYLSVLVRPALYGIDALRISLAAGLAAQEALLDAAGVEIDLRWPNDLMLDGKKCGGILTETAMEGAEGALSYAVIGVGINLNHAAMPEELLGEATSLRMVTGQRVLREDVAVALVIGLQVEMTLVEVMGGLTERFEEASTYVRGARVLVEEDGGYAGVTDGLDELGLLRVRVADGSVRVVRHGGVRKY